MCTAFLIFLWPFTDWSSQLMTHQAVKQCVPALSGWRFQVRFTSDPNRQLDVAVGLHCCISKGPKQWVHFYITAASMDVEEFQQVVVSCYSSGSHNTGHLIKKVNQRYVEVLQLLCCKTDLTERILVFLLWGEPTNDRFRRDTFPAVGRGKKKRKEKKTSNHISFTFLITCI